VHNKNCIAWADNLPTSRPLLIKIMSPKPSWPVLAILLAGEGEGVFTHWVDDRTIPHNLDPEQCPGCRAGQNTRFKFYFPAWDPRESRMVLLEVTRKAIEDFEKLNKGAIMFKRGDKVVVKRRGQKNNSPVMIEMVERNVGLERLPQPFDIRDALCHIWNGEDKYERRHSSKEMSERHDR
jgi:hypothetical protein